MKRKYIHILFLAFAILLTSCNKKGNSEADQTNTDGDQSKGTPVMKFESVYHDFGKLKRGEKVSCTFTFKNTGSTDLIIKDAAASCGCTVPKYDKEPIKPGEKGTVEVIFDSRGFRGVQYKTVLLKTNTSYGEKTLTIKANIVS